MYRLIFLLFLTAMSAGAELKSTAKYELSPFAVDLINNWDDISKFPFKRHFIWEDNPNGFSYYNQYSMSKRFFQIKEAEFRVKLKGLLEKLGLNDKNGHYQLKISRINSRHSSPNIIVGATLTLTTVDSMHSFIDWINNYHVNMSNSPFSGTGIETPVVSAKYTILSVPISVARKYSLDFFPSAKGAKNEEMSNSDFQKFLKELKKQDGVSLYGEYLCRAVSGRTMVVRDIKSHMFPEYYDLIGEKVNTKVYNKKKKQWVPDVEIINPTGIQPIFGEARDVGQIIEFTLQVEPDGKHVPMDIKLNILKHLGWTEFDKEEDIRMPVLQAFSTETRMTGTMGSTSQVCSFYHGARSENVKTSVQPGEQRPFIDNCIVVFLSIESAESKAAYEFKDDQLSFYMTPVGSLAKSSLENMLGDTKDTQKKIKALLSEMGMKFDKNSFFHYDSEFAVISTFNKASEINKLIKFLPKSSENRYRYTNYPNESEPYTNISISHLKLGLSETFAKTVSLENKSDLFKQSVLWKIFTSEIDKKNLEVISMSNVIGQNGNISVNRDVLEIYPPEYFDYFKGAKKTIALPNFGDPIDVGHILEVIPQIDPNYRDVESEFKIYGRDIDRWESFKSRRSTAVFSESTIDTRIKGNIDKAFVLGYEVKNGKIILDLVIVNSRRDREK